MKEHITERHLFVKAADGLCIVDPATGKPIADDGAFVPNSKYWRRRLQDGDVIEAAMPGATKKNQSKKEN